MAAGTVEILGDVDAALVGHLQEEQVGDLLDVVAVVDAVVAQGVAEAPQFLNNVAHGSSSVPYFFFPPARRLRAALSAASALSKARNSRNLLPSTPAETPRRLMPASARRRVIW